jgi:hypothetical protein
VRFAIDGFTMVLCLAALGDARVVIAGGITQGARISRRLRRMCLGLAPGVGFGVQQRIRTTLTAALLRAHGLVLSTVHSHPDSDSLLIRPRLRGYPGARQTTNVIG